VPTTAKSHLHPHTHQLTIMIPPSPVSARKQIDDITQPCGHVYWIILLFMLVAAITLTHSVFLFEFDYFNQLLANNVTTTEDKMTILEFVGDASNPTSLMVFMLIIILRPLVKNESKYPMVQKVFPAWRCDNLASTVFVMIIAQIVLKFRANFFNGRISSSKTFV